MSIGQHVIEKRAARAFLHQIENMLAHQARVLEEEEPQDGDDHHENQIPGHRQESHAELRKLRNQVVRPPSCLGAHFVRHLRLERSRGRLPSGHRVGERLLQCGCLLHHARADLTSDQNDGRHEDGISQAQRDRA